LTLLAGVLSVSSNNTLNDVEPGLLGFLVVAGIGVVLVFLLRSMNKQFRKLPPPEEPEETGTGGASGYDDADANAEDAKRG
jgi:hypothetical protein